MKLIQNQVFNMTHYDNGDVLRCYGKEDHFVIENCVFNFFGVPNDVQDELVSCIEGASVHIKNCVFLGGIKAILAGNGDHPISDTESGTLYMDNCFIGWSGRRCPEVKHGVKAYMRNCWIHDWGIYAFDQRAFGAWACDGGVIAAERCLFTRTPGLTVEWYNRWKDRFNHVGFAINRKGIGELFRPRNWRSGLYRGLTAWDTGTVYASKCYRNNNDIIVENCSEFLQATDAVKIVQQIQDTCPDTYPYMDDTLIGLWYSLF